MGCFFSSGKSGGKTSLSTTEKRDNFKTEFNIFSMLIRYILIINSGKEKNDGEFESENGEAIKKRLLS